MRIGAGEQGRFAAEPVPASGAVKDVANRWSRLGTRFGPCLPLVEASQVALFDFLGRSGASPHQAGASFMAPRFSPYRR